MSSDNSKVCVCVWGGGPANCRTSPYNEKEILQQSNLLLGLLLPLLECAIHSSVLLGPQHLMY